MYGQRARSEVSGVGGVGADLERLRGPDERHVISQVFHYVSRVCTRAPACVRGRAFDRECARVCSG